ncbi:MAG TPA: radical SAM protein [Candidatus Brocadiaceae bacterium]|nr:radical SAM protein [Candidatus Brocadiaceae bacterium]
MSLLANLEVLVAIWSYMRGSEMLDIKVGYRCNNRCLHCVIEPVRQKIVNNNEKPDLTTEEIISIIEDATSNGINTVVLTGGEITTREDFEKIVTYAVNKGLKVNIQTNGRALWRERSCEFMANLPGLLFIVAIHAPHAEIHDAITQVKGSFYETIDAIKNLRNINKEIAAKIVISKLNYQYLYETALFAKGLGVNEFCVVFPHALDFPQELFKSVVPRYYSIKDEVHRIANFSEKECFWISFETIPYCICTDSEAFWRRNCDLLSKAIENKDSRPNTLASEKNLFNWEEIRPKMKEKGINCSKCVFNLLCEGPWREYIQNFGFTEFSPIKQDQVFGLLEDYGENNI